jgi:hypothetical protein
MRVLSRSSIIVRCSTFSRGASVAMAFERRCTTSQNRKTKPPFSRRGLWPRPDGALGGGVRVRRSEQRAVPPGRSRGQHKEEATQNPVCWVRVKPPLRLFNRGGTPLLATHYSPSTTLGAQSENEHFYKFSICKIRNSRSYRVSPRGHGIDARHWGEPQETRARSGFTRERGGVRNGRFGFQTGHDLCFRTYQDDAR